jgi:glucose dehydrogenase
MSRGRLENLHTPLHNAQQHVRAAMIRGHVASHSALVAVPAGVRRPGGVRGRHRDTRAQSPTGSWWTGYGNGPDNSRYFASSQITRRNVTQLQVAWTYPFGDAGSSPIVVRGVIYGRGRNGSLVALDAATGKERWVRENMTA